jgi:hypothetical protein
MLPIGIPHWSDVFSDNALYFAESHVICPLQLADFAAFFLNRTQWILGQETLKDRDRDLLYVLEPLVRAGNYRHLTVVESNLDDWQPIQKRSDIQVTNSDGSDG